MVRNPTPGAKGRGKDQPQDEPLLQETGQGVEQLGLRRVQCRLSVRRESGFPLGGETGVTLRLDRGGPDRTGRGQKGSHFRNRVPTNDPVPDRGPVERNRRMDHGLRGENHRPAEFHHPI